MNFSQTDVKQINRKNVLDLIAERGSISRRDICTLLGSSMTTVLKITYFLEERGWITVSGEASTARGRRPQVLTFQPDMITSLSIDYDGRKVDIALCNYYGKELFFQTYEASNDVVIFFQDNLPRIIKNFLKKCRCIKDCIIGIGICIPGDFSKDGQYSNLGPLSRFQNTSRFTEVFHSFREEIGIPVFCYNDVNASAYGEYMERSNFCGKDLVFLYAGDGFGAGLIINSQLHFGEHDMAGEVGYMSCDTTYVTDTKKPGWLESQLAKDNLVLKFPEFAEGFISDEMVDYIASMISLTIANISNILDISHFVIDGDLVRKLKQKRLMERIFYYTSRLSLTNIDIDFPKCHHPSLSGLSRLVISEELYALVKNE